MSDVLPMAATQMAALQHLRLLMRHLALSQNLVRRVALHSRHPHRPTFPDPTMRSNRSLHESLTLILARHFYPGSSPGFRWGQHHPQPPLQLRSPALASNFCTTLAASDLLKHQAKMAWPIAFDHPSRLQRHPMSAPSDASAVLGYLFVPVDPFRLQYMTTVVVKHSPQGPD